VAGTTYGVMDIVDKRVATDSNLALGYEFCVINGALACQLDQAPLNTEYTFGPAGPDMRDGKFHHVAMSVMRNSTTGGKLYVDGNNVLTFDPTSEAGDLSNNMPLHIGYHPTAGFNGHFTGAIDEISLYKRALSPDEIQTIYLVGEGGKCSPVPPTITAQPTNQTTLTGANPTFNVAASSPLPMSYQWTFNKTNLVSATNNTLTLNGVTTNQAGSYFVTITNQVGSVVSSNAILSVYPSAVSFLNGASFATGNQLQFTVVGVPGFSYAVQASTNLNNWVWLITNTAPFNFADTNKPRLQQQFYRTVYLP
jgi:hypothetical protein